MLNVGEPLRAYLLSLKITIMMKFNDINTIYIYTHIYIYNMYYVYIIYMYEYREKYYAFNRKKS